MISRGVADKGAGKSLLCNRFMKPGEDDLFLNHRSDLSIDEFHSPYINRNHLLYWGCKTIIHEDKEIQFQVRHTVTES